MTSLKDLLVKGLSGNYQAMKAIQIAFADKQEILRVEPRNFIKASIEVVVPHSDCV